MRRDDSQAPADRAVHSRLSVRARGGCVLGNVVQLEPFDQPHHRTHVPRGRPDDDCEPGRANGVAHAGDCLVSGARYGRASSVASARKLFLDAGWCRLLALSLIITLNVNVPIDVAISRWSVETLPADWTSIRDRWQAYHTARTLVSLAGFGCDAGSGRVVERGSKGGSLTFVRRLDDDSGIRRLQ